MTTINFTDQAIQTLNAMSNKVNEISNTYGSDSPEATNATKSLAHCLSNIVRLGGDVWSEGATELGGTSNAGITYGIVWHPKAPPAEYPHLIPSGTWSINS